MKDEHARPYGCRHCAATGCFTGNEERMPEACPTRTEGAQSQGHLAELERVCPVSADGELGLQEADQGGGNVGAPQRLAVDANA